MKDVRLNGLVIYTGHEEQAREYAARLIRQIADQYAERNPGLVFAPVRKFLTDTAQRVSDGDQSQFFSAAHVPGKPMEIEVTDASDVEGVDWHWGPDPAFGNLCRHVGSRGRCTGPDCGADEEDTAADDHVRAVCTLDEAIKDYAGGAPGPEKTVLEAALRVLASRVEPHEHAHSAAEAEYAGGLLALAARALTDATNALPRDQRPVGWNRTSDGAQAAVDRVREELSAWQETIDTGVMAGSEWERCLRVNLPLLRAALDGVKVP